MKKIPFISGWFIMVIILNFLWMGGKRSLIDYTFSGEGIGLYSASSAISPQKSVVIILSAPIDE